MPLMLTTEESTDYMNGLADTVSRRIDELVAANRHCGKTEAALFCALLYLDEKNSAAKRIAVLEKQGDTYEESIADLKRENDELKKLISGK